MNWLRMNGMGETALADRHPLRGLTRGRGTPRRPTPGALTGDPVDLHPLVVDGDSFRTGQLAAIYGLSGGGKTLLLSQIAVNLAGAGTRVLLISAERGAEHILSLLGPQGLTAGAPLAVRGMEQFTERPSAVDLTALCGRAQPELDGPPQVIIVDPVGLFDDLHFRVLRHLAASRNAAVLCAAWSSDDAQVEQARHTELAVAVRSDYTPPPRGGGVLPASVSFSVQALRGNVRSGPLALNTTTRQMTVA